MASISKWIILPACRDELLQFLRLERWDDDFLVVDLAPRHRASDPRYRCSVEVHPEEVDLANDL